MDIQALLSGKSALITGAGRGIGKAIAIAYAQAGAAVCCSARSVDEIQETAQEITLAGGKAIAIPADVTQMESLNAMVAQMLAELGGIDILVINAGVNLDRKPVVESNPEDWRAVIEINLLGAYNTALAVAPHMVQRGSGKIITIGSGLGHHGAPALSAYACSKAGLWMLTQILSEELRPHKISVNELIPGPVITAMNANLSEWSGQIPDFDSEWIKMPEDVVPMAIFLATQPDFGPTGQSFSLLRRLC
jgi:3-oxoacyl-[acyl-carrier protein] reductase